MSFPLEFHPAVQAEVDSAYRWYELQKSGLGAEFLDEIESVLTTIAANPARYGIAEGEVREGLLARFPYAIYYRLLPDRVRVLAVFHTSRNPSLWRSRA